MGSLKPRRIPSSAAFALLSVLLPAAAAAGPLDFDAVQAIMMEPNGIAPRDISLLPPGRPDPFRLSRVEAILRDPFRLEGVTEEVLARTAPDSGRPALPVSPDSLWPLLDAEPSDSAAGFRPETALADIREGLREHTAGL